MEPTDALRAIETALRLAISEVLGATDWLKAPGAPAAEKLRERQEEENKRRDGTSVSTNLLDYTETYHLTGIIQKNWEKFKPVFDDKGRTDAFFGVLEDVRNSVAHSRELVPFERDLISGVAGMLRNQVSLYRSGKNEDLKYYPLIERVVDNFGIEGIGNEPLAMFAATSGSNRRVRIEVGDTLTFTGSAFNAKGMPVTWKIYPVASGMPYDHSATTAAEGDSVSFSYQITAADVGEDFRIVIRIASSSKFRRYGHQMGSGPYDDERTFLYAVNPPDED